jgi:hypothetical protein
VNSTVSWSLALFFGCSIAFAAIRRLTQDSPRGVTLLAQLGLLVIVIAAIVFIVRRQSDE